MSGRIRSVKPAVFQHEKLFDGEIETGLPLRVAFIGLWCQCDREGRFEWRPRQLKLNVIPYDDACMSRVLDALTTRGFVVKYTVNGRTFGAIPSWSKHQVINNRERPSEIPEPTEESISSTREARDDDASATREGRVPQGREGKGREGKENGEARKRATRRCPDDFEVTDEMREWAQVNVPTVDAEMETAKFRDCEFKTPHKDWPATWRNWMRRAEQDVGRTKRVTRTDRNLQAVNEFVEGR